MINRPPTPLVPPALQPALCAEPAPVSLPSLPVSLPVSLPLPMVPSPGTSSISASSTSSAGPPSPASLNHAVPSCTTPKCSEYIPGTQAAPVGPSNANVNVPFAPGATVPLIFAARFGAAQSAPAKMLVRSRGTVVPSAVELFHGMVPVFFNTMFAATLSPHFTVIAGADASGQDWLTYVAPYGICPYAASTAFA